VSIVGGVIYPAIIQGLVVSPDQEAKEAEFIARNVNATREAYGLAEVERNAVTFDDIELADLRAEADAFDNVRLLNPSQTENRFIFDEGREAGLTIADLDVDRYALDSTSQDGAEQVLVAALELDLNGVPNRSWQSLRLINTHGCGLVVAPASSVSGSRPAYTIPDLDQPELYFSPEVGGYAITNSESSENDCDEVRDDDEDQPDDAGPTEYQGELGVEMSSFARRASFALAFLDRNVLLSGAIESDSQMLWVRDVDDRLRKLAPFLSYDADPYPVALDGGVVWVVDAYTTTSRYPYSESVGRVQLSRDSGISASDNYVRNSVKAVVDAYTGDVTLYVVDEVDPIISAWQQAFPDLFSDFAEMPDDLRDHLRYPEDLFRVQTDRYSKYRISAADFFRRDGAWSVAQAPGIAPGQRAASTGAVQPVTAASTTFASESDVERFVPYYTFFDTSAPGEPADEEFVIFRPFVEFSTADQRTQLQAYMVASSDPDSYGTLTSYEVRPARGESLPDGPLRVASSAESTRQISLRISRDNQGDGGTSVRFGDLQAIPVAGGLVYVRPYYVSVATDSQQVADVTEFRGVIVTYDERSVLTDSIDAALAELFPGYEAPPGAAPITGEDDPDELGIPLDVDEENARIRELLADADAARLDGDFEGYLDLVSQAIELSIASELALDDTDADLLDDVDQDEEAEEAEEATDG